MKETASHSADSPHQRSAGMRHVIVNGRQSLENGKHTEEHGGCFLARKN